MPGWQQSASDRGRGRGGEFSSSSLRTEAVERAVVIPTSLISTALSARLMQCGEIAHRNLVDSFRGDDDKKAFAALFNAVIDVRKSCDETRGYALFEPEMELVQSTGLVSPESTETPTGSVTGTSNSPRAATPFLSELPASARDRQGIMESSSNWRGYIGTVHVPGNCADTNVGGWKR
ncbi:hypothetical protein QBC38DRAFT_525503 [Podospora fimiseda]|uniref:Uncharacterized protein n=1 Tax=Podospora fimiseda TaxID=252190 RepID=A0AAN6YJX9_9PEZI|nr:hypothetical protein QBC38DRAFT_525503 [Podospora fimiseda]